MKPPKKKHKKIELGQFFTPKNIVELTYKIIERNNIKYDKIADTSGGFGDFIKENDDIFTYIDIDKDNYKHVKKTYSKVKSINKNSLLNVNRKTFANKTEKLLIIGNPPYNNLSSFYKKGKKGYIKMDDRLKSRDLGISFLRSYDLIQSDYVCVLHPLSYLIKKTNFNQLKSFKDNYKLIDGEIISSEVFNETSNNTSFPILIGLYKRDQTGMSYESIKRFTFPVYDTNYKFSLNQFLYIEDVHTKYKDNTLTGKYKHYSTLRDMNWLSINKGWLEKETTNSIKVKDATPLKIFNYIEKLKEWFTKNKKEFWFLGNLSPIINKELWKKNADLKLEDIDNFFKKELTKSQNTLSIFGNKLIWNFKNINPTGKYRFKTRENLYTHSKIKASATTKINQKDFLEIQIGYDKNIDDFYNKHSIHKLGFMNNKDKQKFIFELSDIFYWGLLEKIITKKNIEKIMHKIKKINILEEEYKIEREDPVEPKIVLPLNFNEVNIKKPSFISDFITSDFIEIIIDYKQKAVGTQAMLFLNLSAKNFRINNEKIIGKKISKKDTLTYIIDKKKYSQLFCNLIIIFSHLSIQHNKDILNILQKIIDEYDGE